MRWAFWRRRRSQPSEHPPSVTPEAVRPAWTGGTDDPPDEPRGAAALSGASPQHATPGPSGSGELLSDRTDPLEVDLPAVRADLVAVVEAVLARDRDRLDVALQQLETRGDDHTAVAAFAAMGLLGELCAAAAGVDPDQLEPGAQSGLEALAQGETLAGRADSLLRFFAPSSSSGLVRLVVHLSCGSFDIHEQPDPAPREMLLVAAVLLAQTCADGQLAPDELITRLVEMLVPEP